jgi:hypothetical protein
VQSASWAQATQTALTPLHAKVLQAGVPAAPLANTSQVPSWAAPVATAHALQAPSQASSQQTLSEQKSL